MSQGLGTCGRVWGHMAGVGGGGISQGLGAYVKCQKVKDVDYE